MNPVQKVYQHPDYHPNEESQPRQKRQMEHQANVEQDAEGWYNGYHRDAEFTGGGRLLVGDDNEKASDQQEDDVCQDEIVPQRGGKVRLGYQYEEETQGDAARRVYHHGTRHHITRFATAQEVGQPNVSGFKLTRAFAQV